MAQLVARLVRNEKVGGSNPPSSTTGRHPIRMSVFLYAWALLRCLLLCCFGAAGVPGAASALLGRAAWCARGRRPAREPSAPRAALGASSRSPARPRRRPRAPQPGPPDPPAPSTPAAAGVSKPGQAQPPLTGTAVWPFGPSGTLHTGGTWCAVVSTGSASTLYAVQSSPCSGCWWPKRYKVRPARTKLAKTGHFERAGRVLYRTCNEEGCAGRFLYRKRGRMARAGRILLRPPAPSSGPEPLRRH